MNLSIRTKTVAFFGHRHIDNHFETEKELERIVENLINKEEYVEFLVGRNGDFDILVSSVIRRIQRKSDKDNSSLVLILPYVPTHDDLYWKSVSALYDVVEVCEKSANAHFKAAISIRNRNMVDRAETIYFYIERNFGGAYNAFEYAEKQGKNCVLLNSAHKKTE